jgi:hypothetical protein
MIFNVLDSSVYWNFSSKKVRIKLSLASHLVEMDTDADWQALDPDPDRQNDADPAGFGSTTLE